MAPFNLVHAVCTQVLPVGENVGNFGGPQLPIRCRTKTALAKGIHSSCSHCLIKATFHYSSLLQTWLQTWFSTRFAARFSTSSCGFATCFRHAFDTLPTVFVENLVANLLHQSRHVEIDAAGSLVRARARQMECSKTVSSQPTNLLKLDFRYVFYYSCLP